MIYSLSPELYPSSEQVLEEISYLDENNFEWKIARVEKGLFIKYFGDPYFKETYFSCLLNNGEHVVIKNTNCIFINDTKFETFTEIINIIKNSCTDEIWEALEKIFAKRFEHDMHLLLSEYVE